MTRLCIGPAHQIKVLITYACGQALNVHAQLSGGANCLTFGLSFQLLQYFMHAISEGSVETAHAAQSHKSLRCSPMQKVPVLCSAHLITLIPH